MRTGNLKSMLSCSVATLALLGLTAPAHGEGTETSGEDLRQQIETQQQELNQLRDRLENIEETQKEATAAPAQAVTAGDTPRSFKIPGTDTSLSIGGYIKGDVIYDVGADLGDTFAVSAIPAAGSVADERDGQVSMHSKQSRFWIKTSTPTEAGAFKTHFEADFFTGDGNEVFSNSSHLRLRHAYGELGGLLVGQTWTNFMSLHSYADTVDFFGPVGMPFIRATQVRYTFTPSDNLAVAISVENPEVSGRDQAGNSLNPDATTPSAAAGDQIDRVPDLVGSVKYSDSRITAKVSGVARTLELDDGLGVSASESGFGVHGSLSIIPFGSDLAFANVTFGEGVGRYLINGAGNDIIYDTGTNTIQTPEMLAWAIGYTHAWNPKFNSTLVWGHSETDTFLPGDIDTLDSVHANLWWNVADNARLGLEYMYGNLELADGSENDASRVQFGAQFSF